MAHSNSIIKYTCIIDTSNEHVLQNNPHTIQHMCCVDRICEGYANNIHNVLKYRFIVDSTPPYHTKNLLKKPPYINNHIIRQLDDHSPKLKYSERKQLPKTTVHWGQMKLLIGEMDFFNKYIDPSQKYTVIYVGAAMGTHLIVLIEMYTNCHFVLIDPAKFYPLLHKKKRVTIINDYMTNDLATELKGKYDNIIYISDIRLLSDEFEPSDDSDIIRDQEMQKQWYYILDPIHSMLKFRLPWNTKKYPSYTYLEGDVYLQCFAPHTSTETRLIVRQNAKEIEYNVFNYEDKLFYFNMVNRSRYYKHQYDLSRLYMDHCYDCAVTLHVVETFLQGQFNINFKTCTVNKLMKVILRILSKGNKKNNKLFCIYKQLLHNLS